MTIAALIATALLAALTTFQLALIFGAPLGRFAWGGQHDILPKKLRISSVTSILIYAIFAAIILDKADLVNSLYSDTFVSVATWVLFAYFTLGILMNSISRSRLERNLMTPVAATLAILTLVIALN